MPEPRHDGEYCDEACPFFQASEAESEEDVKASCSRIGRELTWHDMWLAECISGEGGMIGPIAREKMIAQKRLALKRELRRSGIEIPQEILGDLEALRQLRDSLEARMKDEVLTCSCCGGGVFDTPEHNASFDKEPYPHDSGFGLCIECGGDKSVTDEEAAASEEAYRRRIGKGAQMFFDSRVRFLKANLGQENRRKFEAMPYREQVGVISKMVAKGKMT